MNETPGMPQQHEQQPVTPWVRPDFEAFDTAPEVTAYFARAEG